MKYHFKIHKEATGFWAECLEIPGCVTQAESCEELSANMEDAINTFLQEPEGTKYLAPLPDSSHKPSPSVVKVGVDPQIALGFWVRYNRIKKGMTQDEAAKRLGMKSLFSYQRLERKCNATVAMISKLMALFPRLNLEAVFN